MSSIRILLCYVVAALAAGQAVAAPFCVDMTGIPLQCLYADPALCQRDADRQGGRCAANPAEFLTPAGSAPFCVIESGNVASCTYPDLASCDAESRRRGGACIAAVPSPTPPAAVDPFALRRPY